MTKFQIGDKVKFLNSIGGGVVTKITNDFIFVRDFYSEINVSINAPSP